MQSDCTHSVVCVDSKDGARVRIGINVALAGTQDGYRRTGVSRYITELVSAMHPRLDPVDRLIRMGDVQGKGLLGWTPARIAWEQAWLPFEVRAQQLDVLHSPVNVTPIYSRGTPSVVTVHDLAFLRYPEHVSRRRHAWLSTAIRLSVLRADRIIAVSSSTADDLEAWVHRCSERIDVVPSASSPDIQRINGSILQEFRRERGIERPFILAVGTLEPRKNLPALLKAFAKIKYVVPHDLVLVGPEGWLTNELHSTIRRLGLGDRLRMTGFVSDAELGGWYSSAALFVFPSFYEGFGLPAVEAMHCGAPVLASDSSSLKEVIGDAGVLLPPDDVDLWADAMASLLADPARLDELRRLSLGRSKNYSWTRTAAMTYETYRSVIP